LISVQAVKPYNFLLPSPFRYIEREYLTDFFEKGILRISSFNRFRNYSDEIRGDQREGQGNFLGHDPDYRVQFVVQTDDFDNSYMLSTSLLFKSELFETFNCDACFQILDPIGFSVAISNSLTGFIQSVNGFCQYEKERLIKTEFPSVDMLDFRNEEGAMLIGDKKMRQRVQEISKTGYEKLFLKEIKYQDQVEYRFIWIIDPKYHTMSDYIDLNCPEAIQFCKIVNI